MTRPNLPYVSGTGPLPLHYRTVGAALDATIEEHAERDALIVRHQDIRWNWQDLGQRVDAIAAGLVSRGFQPGDRIGIWSPNNAEWVVTQLAAAKAGLILVNINPAYRLAELEYALNKVQCRALILARSFKTSNYVEMLQALAPEIDRCAPGELDSVRLPHLELVAVIGQSDCPGILPFDEIGGSATKADWEKLAVLGNTLQPEDAMNIQFTSGTTGSPKGATLSHHNVLNNGFFVTERQMFGPRDRLCIPVPLYHCFGMVLGVLGCVTHGSCMVFPDEAFDPGSVLKTVEEEGCTALYGVPTMFIAILDHPEFRKFDLSTLRTGVMAGSPCPVEVMKRVIDEMHMSNVTIGYGMTETSPVSFQTTVDDPLEKRVGTVGRVHPHVEVKIVDENGCAVPRGVQGELCTRGYSVMHGYWQDEEKTAQTIDRSGWLHSGDLATMDVEGYVQITGRVKDMIIRGGENIYPREIEEFLHTHPDISDVQVFGISDEKYGEAVCAWVMLQEGGNADGKAIRAFCEGQIAHFKVPRHVRIVEAFPMTVTGKIQKFAMREQMERELGLNH